MVSVDPTSRPSLAVRNSNSARSRRCGETRTGLRESHARPANSRAADLACQEDESEAILARHCGRVCEGLVGHHVGPADRRVEDDGVIKLRLIRRPRTPTGTASTGTSWSRTARRSGPGRSTRRSSRGSTCPARELPAHRRVYLDYEGEVSGGRGTVRRWDRGECGVLEWGEDRVRLEVRGAQLVGIGRAPEGRGGGPAELAVPPREVELKDPAGRAGSGVTSGPVEAVGAAGEADLALADAQALQDDVGPALVGLVADQGDRAGRPRGSTRTSRPCSRACSVIGPMSRSAEIGITPARIFSRVRARTLSSGTRAWATTQITERIGPSVELEGQGDPVGLEGDPGLVDLGRDLVGEVGDEVLGEPGVDLLVGEDGLPVALVADVVAELEAAGDEVLGLGLALLAGDVGQGPVERWAGGSARARPPRGRSGAARRPARRGSARFLVARRAHGRPAFRGGAGEGRAARPGTGEESRRSDARDERPVGCPRRTEDTGRPAGPSTRTEPAVGAGRPPPLFGRPAPVY